MGGLVSMCCACVLCCVVGFVPCVSCVSCVCGCVPPDKNGAQQLRQVKRMIGGYENAPCSAHSPTENG